MQSAAFAAGAMSPPVPPVVLSDPGAETFPVLGVGAPPGMADAHEVSTFALPDAAVVSEGTLASAFSRTHSAALAAGATLTVLPVVVSPPWTGDVLVRVGGDPVPTAPHVEASCAMVLVSDVALASRHAATPAAGAVESVVPVRSSLTFALGDPPTVEGPVPQSVESDALPRSFASGGVWGVDASARRHAAARAVVPAPSVVPVMPLVALSCAPPSAVDGPASQRELSVDRVASALACASRQMSALACAPPERRLRLTGSFAPIAALAPLWSRVVSLANAFAVESVSVRTVESSPDVVRLFDDVAGPEPVLTSVEGDGTVVLGVPTVTLFDGASAVALVPVVVTVVVGALASAVVPLVVREPLDVDAVTVVGLTVTAPLLPTVADVVVGLVVAVGATVGDVTLPPAEMVVPFTVLVSDAEAPVDVTVTPPEAAPLPVGSGIG
jgi:hypothetical protein